MRISSVRVINYKSYSDSGEIKLSKGFNVIIGKNNGGKTALLQALSLRHENKPHRSEVTVPYRGASLLNSASIVNISFETNSGELEQILADQGNTHFTVPVLKDANGVECTELQVGDKFKEVISGPNRLICEYNSPDSPVKAYLPPYGEIGSNFAEDVTQQLIRVERSKGQIQIDILPQRVKSSLQSSVIFQIASCMKKKLYYFAAERLNVGECQFGTHVELDSNAQNLAECLNVLQGSNPNRFDRLNELVHIVFPDVFHISISPLPSHMVRINVWNIPTKTERDDLALSLAECGTGIGQVLAILYVVLTSDFPRSIIIDEPQSFLHPGAVQKLFEILKGYPQHQYIVSTHSPAVVTAADPDTLIRVYKDGFESKVETIDATESNQLRSYLLDVGARLSDVFGADNILWVEGQTEEQCFPLILKEM